jgi:hypothetical protein
MASSSSYHNAILSIRHDCIIYDAVCLSLSPYLSKFSLVTKFTKVNSTTELSQTKVIPDTK